MVIAAFAGCGKTMFAAMQGDDAIDLVCMPYKYELDENNSYDGVESEAGKANFDNELNEEWPHNYVDAIENAVTKYKYVIIPSDWLVLCFLEQRGIEYTLVYPQRECKDEYEKRYIARGNTENFLSVFIGRWDRFMDTLQANNYGKHIVLDSGQFLSDVIK